MKKKPMKSELPFTQWAASGVHVSIDPAMSPQRALGTLRHIADVFEQDMNRGLTASQLVDLLTQPHRVRE